MFYYLQTFKSYCTVVDVVGGIIMKDVGKYTHQKPGMIMDWGYEGSFFLCVYNWMSRGGLFHSQET